MSLLGSSIVLVLSLLSAVHLYWAAGGRRGLVLALPERNGRPLFHPSPVATLTVAGGLAGAALLVALWSGAAAAPPPAIGWGVRGLAALFLLRAVGDFRHMGFFSRVRVTRFATWDRRLYSPLCLALGAALLVLSL